MDASRFTESKTGQLVRITGPDDWAFIPAPLPPVWKFPEELWPVLVKAREALARLDGIGRTLPNPQLLLHPLQQGEALRSSSLEGTYARAEDLLLFELNPRSPSSEHDKTNDWLEVANYGLALREGWNMLLEGTPLSLRLIRHMHKCLLGGVRGRDKAPGEFRNYQVHVGSDRRYVPPPVPAMHECLDSFEKHMNSLDEGLDPLVRAYLFHYQFEAIHPFRDGNGRVGRSLLSLMIARWCDLRMPWLYMSAFFERYKDEYIDKLFRVSTEAAWGEWIKFCLNGTVLQAEEAIRRCDLLGTLKKELHAKVDGLGPRMHPIIDILFDNPAISIVGLRNRFDISYPTARNDIQALVKAGILEQVQDLHPKTFLAPAILSIAYGE